LADRRFDKKLCHAANPTHRHDKISHPLKGADC
jgi:hypothetical protein